MKKWRIETTVRFQPSPMSFWVHRQLDHEVWAQATQFEPALPKPLPGRGYAVLVISFSGTELRFASTYEVETFLKVISQKNMPTSLQLTRSWGTKHGPNSHWLSRLPAKLKPWKKRQELIPIIIEGLNGLKSIQNG